MIPKYSEAFIEQAVVGGFQASCRPNVSLMLLF